MSQAFSFFGGDVKLGDGMGTETFTAIEEVQTVEFTGSKVDLADVTHVHSPNRRREYIGTLIDSGELAFTANYIPGATQQGVLQTTMDAALPRNWEVVLPSSLGTLSFAGVITSIDRNLSFDKEAKLSVKVKVTGPIDYAA
jgi:predicted secreted protein